MRSPYPTPRELSAELGFRVTAAELSAGLLLAVQVFMYDRRKDCSPCTTTPLGVALLYENRPKRREDTSPLVLHILEQCSYITRQSIAVPANADAKTRRRYAIANGIFAHLYDSGRWAAPWVPERKRVRHDRRSRPSSSARSSSVARNPRRPVRPPSQFPPPRQS